MTPAQMELLRGLSRAELLVAIKAMPSSLALSLHDRDVVSMVRAAILVRCDRLDAAVKNAREGARAAEEAWSKRRSSDRLCAAARSARSAETRAWRASERAHCIPSRIP